MLLQGDQLLGCCSGLWKDAETRWHCREQELMGVICCLRNWRYLLVGRPVSVYTDHKANLGLHLNTKVNFVKVSRWVAELAQYNVNWHYVKGSLHTLPDWLSRICYNMDKSTL